MTKRLFQLNSSFFLLFFFFLANLRRKTTVLIHIYLHKRCIFVLSCSRSITKSVGRVRPRRRARAMCMQDADSGELLPEVLYAGNYKDGQNNAGSNANLLDK